jgi:adenylate kinase
MAKPKSFIMIGVSGGGKGTQSARIAERLAKDGGKAVYVQTGFELREFIQGPSATAKLAKDYFDKGLLIPEFLAVYLWAAKLIREFSGSEHVVIDGTPRKLEEAALLHSVFGFYKREKPYVIYLKVGKDTAAKRLAGRGRSDDGEAQIKERLSWFEANVLPAVEFYRRHPDYRFIEIDGEKSVDEVWADIESNVTWND